MAGDLDLTGFTGPCRLFPLPNVVLFPHVVVPLHIFEPRYRQMTEDTLATDGLVAIVRLRDSVEGTAELAPPVEPVACLGRIIEHERLPDGRFNILFLGCKRVRLIRELPTEKLYRVAEVEVLEDEYDREGDESQRSLLVEVFRHVLSRPVELSPDLDSLLKTDLPLGVLTDVLAYAMGLPAPVGQILLAENRVDHRAESLLKILRELQPRNPDFPSPEPSFPPRFSAN